jgi:excisionase family DNA binding protein
MSDHTAPTSGHEAPSTAATSPISVEQAAAVLGVSVTTVKRRIRDGSLRAEEADRPQGTVWLVYLDPAVTPASDADQAAATSGHTAPTVPATVPTTPAADAMVALIQATIGTILGPLVGELAASRQTIERQAGQLVSQAETIGRLSAALESSEARHAALLASGTTEAPGRPRSRPHVLSRPPGRIRPHRTRARGGGAGCSRYTGRGTQ